jgi:hypothetical protein
MRADLQTTLSALRTEVDALCVRLQRDVSVDRTHSVPREPQHIITSDARPTVNTLRAPSHRRLPEKSSGLSARMIIWGKLVMRTLFPFGRRKE